MIPVSVITGFLGSGKTTLLRELLRDSAMGRTAVIINEFGEIGIDHDLIATSDENFIQLTTGCLCCRVRSDLVLTLSDMAARRAAGTLPAFDRVVVETTGLADPAPILHALMSDRDLNEIYVLGNVITTVDAVHGYSTLDNHAQSLRQAAAADRIVITKTDMQEANTTNLRERLASLNPGASLHTAVHGKLPAAALFDADVYATVERLPQVERWREADRLPHMHDDHITSFCVVRDAPLHAVTLALLLEALTDNCGGRLLRVKGIVNVIEQPARPAVIHGVQHLFHPPQWLDHWPSADRRTRLVFIAHDAVPSSWSSWVCALIEALEAEVVDETRRRQERVNRQQA